MRNHRLISLVFLLLSLLSCSTEKNIEILVTTDIHGAFVQDKDNNSSLANAATYINKVRKMNKDTILLDNGDVLQGTPALYYFNFIKKDSVHIVSKVMNHLKYDAASIGNHDIEAGYKNVKRIEKEFSFPWLSANITLNETKMPLFKPYTVIEMKGLKIAILALSTLTSQKAVRPEELEIIKLNDLTKSAEKWMNLIKKDVDPDVVIGLFHEGLELSKPVIQNVRGFDMVFTGHDHLEHNETVRGPDGKSVIVLGSKARGKSLVHAKISIKKDKITFSGKVESLEKVPQDPGFLEFMKSFQNEIESYEKSIAAEIEADLSNEDYVELIHKTLLNTTKGEISITAPTSKNVTLKKGAVTVKDLFNIYPFDNHPVLLTLSGREINSLLKFSIDLQNGDSPLKRFYNDLSAVYKVPLPLEDEKVYKVAMNSYHAYDGGNMLSLGTGLNSEMLKERRKKDFSENIREHLFNNNSPLISE